jgi:cation:H+ antiporter
MPEIAVSVIGAVDILMGAEMSAVSGVVVGNKIGSYINQVTIIMGIVGLVGLMSITKRELRREGIMLILSIILFSLVSLDLKITPLEGVLVTLAYLVYFIYLVKQEAPLRSTSKVEEGRPKTHPFKDSLMILIGMGGLLYAAGVVLESRHYRPAERRNRHSGGRHDWEQHLRHPLLLGRRGNDLRVYS